jgi:hypothetical protein
MSSTEGTRLDQSLFVHQVRLAYPRVNQEAHDESATGTALGLMNSIDAEGGIPLQVLPSLLLQFVSRRARGLQRSVSSGITQPLSLRAANARNPGFSFASI